MLDAGVLCNTYNTPVEGPDDVSREPLTLTPPDAGRRTTSRLVAHSLSHCSCSNASITESSTRIASLIIFFASLGLEVLDPPPPPPSLLASSYMIVSTSRNFPDSSSRASRYSGLSVRSASFLSWLPFSVSHSVRSGARARMVRT